MSQGDADLWQKIGYLYQENKSWDQAQYCFGRCLKRDPHNYLVLEARARCFENMSDWKKAIKCYLRLLTFDSENARILKICAKVPF